MELRVPGRLEVGSLVIADLHLAVLEEQEVLYFVDWLAGLQDVPGLVVLGDLFDYWVGMAQLRFPATRRVVEALSERVAGGTRVDILVGNRDFLLDRGFERRTGCHVHARGFSSHLPDGQRVSFLHGDELCTLDRRYQRMRRVLRSGPVRWLAPRLPGLSDLAARRLRKVSRKEVSGKPQAVVALQEGAAASWLERTGADLLVCGHAHRYRDVRVGQARWLVLDAFGGPRSVLEVSPEGSLELSGRRPAASGVFEA